MEAYTRFILKHKRWIIAAFIAAAVICAFLSQFVGVDYSFADYLPKESESTVALDTMEKEYDTDVPNMRVMIKDVSIAKALSYKSKLAAVDGVEEITWLDDSVNIYQPLETLPEKTVEAWYKDKNALFSLTIDKDKEETAVRKIRSIIGSSNCMSGTAVTDVYSPVRTSQEVQHIIFIVIPIIFAILILTTASWFEPVLFLFTIGIAIVLNRGTNLVFGEISFVTNAAGSILQLAVSMDYSIFLLNRFEENRKAGMEAQEAMIKAVHQSTGSILSSGLTTVTGFAALILMRFGIGPDMGWVMVKAICFSLATVLCLLPALALSTYKLIDRTEHRSFIPPFDNFAKAVMKVRIPVFAIFIIVLIPCVIAQNSNTFIYGSSRVYSTNQTWIGRDMNQINDEYGQSNEVVLMVPKGDTAKEEELNADLLDLDDVSSVISYVNSVGSELPEEIVPNSTLKQLESKHYSRFVITVEKSEGEDGWDDQIKEIRSLGKKYYGSKALTAGDLASTLDLKTTITADNVKVNILAIVFVLLILIVKFRALFLPALLTLLIETAIWINMAVPYFSGTTLHYIGYLIISSVQLGATIDYAILMSSRYIEERENADRWEAARRTVSSCAVSVMTSAAILALSGMALGLVSTNLVLSQLGVLVGRGAVISLAVVLFILPPMLAVCDRFVVRKKRGAVKRQIKRGVSYEQE
ncbi:MAG: RND family transporter [Candidatus Weimeria sp.]